MGILFASAYAQAQDAVPDPQATLSISVKVVALDAVVHDKRGELVAGLDKDAFRLRVDGQQVADPLLQSR